MIKRWTRARRTLIWALTTFSLALLGARPAPAALYTEYFSSGFSGGGVIPDNDLGGWQDSRNLALGSSLWIQEVTVTLNLISGWNGDLYLSLRHQTPAGTGFAVLLNRVGAPANDGLGYGDAGFGPDATPTPFRLSDAGTYDVHFYQDHSPVYNGSGQLTGTWKPDGSSLVSFQNLDPNGMWTLAAIDQNGGDVSTVLGWGLEIEVVPEVSPVVPALVVLAGAGLLHCRHLRR